MRFQVLVASMKRAAFWYIAPCSLVKIVVWGKNRIFSTDCVQMKLSFDGFIY
jgi:hypothetical protein